MKNTILLILVSLLALSCHVSRNVSEHQSRINTEYKSLGAFASDTVAYVQHNFIDNKDAYIGKKLPALLNDLEPEINGFNYTSTLQVGLIKGINLFFTIQRTQGYPFPEDKEFVILRINFEETIIVDPLIEVARGKGDGLHPEQIAYLKNCIIEDVIIGVYP